MPDIDSVLSTSWQANHAWLSAVAAVASETAGWP